MTRDCGNYVQVLKVTAPGDPTMTTANAVEGWNTPCTEGELARYCQAGPTDYRWRLEFPTTVWNEKRLQGVRMKPWWCGTQEATRSDARANNHSIADLTQSSLNVELNWSIPVEEDAMGSDHEVLGVARLAVSPEALHTTGYDIRSCDPRGRTGQAREAAEDNGTYGQAIDSQIGVTTARSTRVMSLREACERRRWEPSMNTPEEVMHEVKALVVA
jgi:hypothetical protein